MRRKNGKLTGRPALYGVVVLLCWVLLGPASGYILPGMVQPVLAQSSGYTVTGTVIRDPQNGPIQLRGVNWFGFEVPDHVVHGLWARNWQDMIAQMKGLGFNAVRVPICPPTLQGSSVSSINYSLNPDLAGKNSLQILDTILARLDAEGMYILLDHHRPDCNAISELWYTGSYSEQQWIDDLVFMATRYSHLPHFFALDLKNEPHGSATWGSGNNSTDWNKAAERAGAAVLAANPNLLIFVEGIGESATCSGNIGHWWGGNLEPQACTPINLPANKLVLSPHVYGPDVYNQPYFNLNEFPANMPAIWESHFGQFSPAYSVVIGEFGGRYGHGGHANDKIWQDAFVDYLISKDIRNTFYWSWNANSGDTGGILQDDWTTVWTDKVTLLQRLWDDGNPSPTSTPVTPAPATNTPATPATATSTPLTPATATPTPAATLTTGPGGSCRVTYVQNDWGNGFTADVLLENLGSTPWNSWTLAWSFGGNQQITNLWNGNVNQSGQAVQVTNAAWNGTVAAGSSTRIGFQASYSAANAAPTAFQINGVPCNGADPLPTATNTTTNMAMPSATNTPIATATHTPPHTPTPSPTNTVPAIPTHTPTVTPVNTVPPIPTASPTPVVGATCQVIYRISNQWQDGFTGDVTVHNLSSTPWNDWTVAWSFAGNQQITNLWNGAVTQSGQAVQVANAGWNGSVAAGGSTNFGFQAAYSGPNAIPTSFRVNGVPCTSI